LSYLWTPLVAHRRNAAPARSALQWPHLEITDAVK